MMLLAFALAIAAIVYVALRSRGGKAAPADENASAALDALVADAIEREIAQTVLGMRASSDDERAKLRKALRGTDADTDVVSRLEHAVKSIDLEIVRYAHETDAEVNVSLTYEDGRIAKLTRRAPLPDLPRSVRDSFEKKSITRAFVAWQLPWRR
jgi:hypothetical protein